MNIANDQRTLKEIENKILYMLANASGELRVNVASKESLFRLCATCRKLCARGRNKHRN